MTEKKQFKELQFSDAFMFASAMQDGEICRGVLERTLGIPVKEVRVRSENSLLVNSDYRGVRMDVYADDEAGTVFDVEMQTTDKRNLPQRSRFYQGQMDMEALRPGDGFLSLPRSFIIFICTFDPFGQGLYRYTCEMRCRETDEVIGDGACRVFLNTRGTKAVSATPGLIRFLKYVESAVLPTGEEDPLIDRIDARISALKRDHGMEVEYMQFSEMLRDEREEGRAEGRAEGRREGIEEGRHAGEDHLLELMNLMEADGLGDQIAEVRKDLRFRKEMYEKYHLEA